MPPPVAELTAETQPRGAALHHHSRPHPRRRRDDVVQPRGQRQVRGLFAASAQASSTLSPPSSRKSQPFALLHSRMTVTAETFKTSAVSSTVSPPKYRSSTI